MHFDAIVVGGSFAGLSAALYVARGRRPVCVIDSGIARNRFAAASHGVFGHDGRNPQALLGEARQQLQAYANARFIAQPAISAQANGDGFQVQLADGQILTARKLVLAFGVTDVLPDIPGLAAGWGVSVLHCPYCHGYEFSGRRLGVLYAGPGSYRHVRLIAEWGPTTLYLNGETELDPGQLAALEADDITIERDRIAAALGDNGQLSALQLEDGRQLPIDALYIHTQPRLSSPLAEQLGCAIDETPFGPVIQTDAGKQTSVPGVYAAGDIARAPHNATWAAADGVTAGVSLHQALVFP